MEKLFILNNKIDSDYSKELDNFINWNKSNNYLNKLDYENLNESYLKKNKIKLIISNELNKKWFLVFKKYKIISIIIGNSLNGRGDIYIDFKNSNENNIFYNFKSLSDQSYLKLLNLIKIIEILKWDSNFFGYKIASITTDILRENIMEYIYDFVNNNNVKLIYYLCNCHDRKSVEIAEKNNFNFVDIRIQFEKQINKIKKITNNKFRVSLASLDDFYKLKTISSGIYDNSRYYFDKNFDILKVNQFYFDWIEKSILGKFDDECYCLYKGEKVIGFCTVKYKEYSEASIGLFGITKTYQGKGLAKLLLDNIFNIMFQRKIKKLSVVTQGRNYGAQRTYQKSGFLTKKTELWYHKWIN